MTSSVLALTTGLHQNHPPVFIFRSSRPLLATPVHHTARVPPVNNSYCVGLRRGVREQNRLPDATPEPQDAELAHRVHHRVRHRTAMHPKTTRQRNTQHIGNQQATAMRKHPGFQTAQTRAATTTEYQDRFLPPYCHTVVSTTTRKTDPYHPLKGTNADVTTFRSYYVTHKWIKNPPKAPQPPVQHHGQRRCSTTPHNHLHFLSNQNASEVVDYTSVYQNDFKAWTASRRQPIKQRDCLNISQGLVVTNSAPNQHHSKKSYVQVADDPKSQETQPIESITSYRSAFVPHPVQPRQRREKPVYQPNKGLSVQHAVSLRPKATWDGAGEFHHQFKTLSLETKFHGQGQTKESGPSADHIMFLSTTHADYTAHKCQRAKPVLPYQQTSVKQKEPFQATTTMKEDFNAWDTPRGYPTFHKEELGWPTKSTFSVCPPKSADSCKKKNPGPYSFHPKWNGTAVCNSSCNATEKPQCPAENGAFSNFECISNGNKESTRCRTASLDRVTWADGDICEAPSEAHQIISCMVSSRC